MAIYAPIHKTFWTDKDLRKLGHIGMHLFNYLFSGPNVTASGMYNISIERMAYDSMIPEDKIREILLNGQIKNVSYDEKSEYVFVHNKLKFSPGGRKELVRISVNNEFKRSPFNPLWKIFNQCHPGLLIDFSTDGQQMPNSYPTDEKIFKSKSLSTVGQQILNRWTSDGQQSANSYSTDDQQLDNSCPTDGQQTNTNTNTMFSLELKTNHPLPLPGRKGDRKKLLGNKGQKFKEIFKRFPGRREYATFCKTRFMAQINSEEDLEALETALDKYIAAHKARKVSDMARIRFMKSNVFFDNGWQIVAQDDWQLGKPQEIKIVKSREALNEESDYFKHQALKELTDKNYKKLQETVKWISEFQADYPEMPKVLSPDLQIKIDSFLTQQEA